MSALEELGVEPSGSFVVRTPALPYEEFLAWGKGVEGDGTDVIRERLKAAIDRPEVREAIFVGSPRVAGVMQAWLDDPSAPANRKIEHSLVRYFARMAGRATPFGLFAGSSIGQLGDETVLRLGDRGTYQRRTRLDMEYLSTLVSELERDPELRARLKFRPNSSLYLAAGRLRYAEARTTPAGRSHHLVAVETSDYLEATLQRAQSGAGIDELADALVDEDITFAEARDFVTDLIENQLLVSELEPPVTGPEPIEFLTRTLGELQPESGVGSILTAGRAALDRIDSQGMGAVPASYLSVADSLGHLGVPVELNRLFQVDLTKPASNVSLGPRVIEAVARGVRLLQRLSGRSDRNDLLARFRSAFNERYGDREVLLVEALDEELGIGFEASSAPTAEASPLLAGLTFDNPPDELAPWRWREQALLTKVIEATREANIEISLSTDDVDELSGESQPLPEAFSVGATVAARSDEAIDRGDFRVLVQGLYGPSGGRLIGRFCHADPQQLQLLLEHLRQEEALHPDVAYAEIVHLPEGRLGNILLRPVLRGFEIPYLGRSGAPEDRHIPVQDLYVSVREDRVLLWSRTLDREVRPRLTSAHNYSWRSLGVYRFLCALQGQGSVGGLMWDWGVLEGAPFLPRVRVGDVILVRASWLVSQRELSDLKADDPAGWHDWRQRRSIPRYVALVDADNELIIDWLNALSVRSFLALVQRRPGVRLIEVWPDPEELVVTGPEGRFRHELVIPFVARAPGVTAPARTTVGSIRTSFPPGSEWLYAKLYSGTATLDVLLRDHVGPLLREMLSDGTVDSWFFIRYGDPHWHLRLRLHGDRRELMQAAAPRLQEIAARLLDDGLVWNLQLDTYVREVDRYGGPDAIEIVERIFRADSDAALRVVELISGDAGMDARWRLTLRSAHLLLDDFAFSLAERALVVRSLRDSFAAEFGSSPELKKQVGKHYRDEKRALEALLSEPGLPELALAQRAFTDRSEELRPLVAELRTLDAGGRLFRGLPDIASSLVHMTANRLLRSAARAQEMVIYDLLDRLYLARQKRTSDTPR